LLVVAFDVDGTLEISGGPIPLSKLWELKKAGVVVGVVGNWELAIKHIRGLDFYQAGIPNKAEILRAIGEGKVLRIYVGDTEDDAGQALAAGWIFLYPRDFR